MHNIPPGQCDPYVRYTKVLIREHQEDLDGPDKKVLNILERVAVNIFLLSSWFCDLGTTIKLEEKTLQLIFRVGGMYLYNHNMHASSYNINT